VADQLGLGDTEGVIVSQVMRGGPADKAGLKPYDIIIEFNGKKLRGPGDLQVSVGDSDVGRKVAVKVLRFEDDRTKKTLNLDVTLDENPEDLASLKPTRESKPPQGGKAVPHDLGFKVADETPKLRQFYNVSPEAKGPIIVEVAASGPAARVGLREGDVILDVNRQTVSKASDVASRLVKGRNLIRVARGNTILIAVVGTK
jgi:serine protease Do